MNKSQLRLLENGTTTQFGHFMEDIIKLAQKRSNKIRNIYSDDVKMFSSFLYMIGGKTLYQTLSANLPLPSISTVQKTLSNCNRNSSINEGELRVVDLKKFLCERNLPLKVWLAEDGTRILRKIHYDPAKNQLIGNVLPLNSKSGMPEKGCFVVKTGHQMYSIISERNISNYAYVIMAQPLQLNADSFCLCIFGTDNRFTSTSVLNRWRYIQSELLRNGIDVIGFSSDGDSRLLRAMKIRSKLPSISCLSSNIPDNWREWFCCEYDSDFLCVQDNIHIQTKLRTRFLKTSKVLVLGNRIISPQHLFSLIENVSKSDHLLCKSDLDLKDKMNYKSALKMSEEIVSDSLNKYVSSSEATVMYLKIMRYTRLSYSDKNVPHLKRVYYMWYITFFLRIWRKYLNKSAYYSITNNFITYNTYCCIELNAHMIINAIIKARKCDTDIFLPTLYQSQTCEQFFRATRSMTSTFSTMVNFSMFDLLNRAKRIDLINEIKNKLGYAYKFRTKSEENAQKSPLPSNSEIFKVVMEAQHHAITDAQKFGIQSNENECIPNELEPLNGSDFENVVDEESEDDAVMDVTAQNISCETESLEFDMQLIFSERKGDLNIKEMAFSNDVCIPNTYVAIKKNNGSVVYIKKSSLLWLMCNSELDKVSPDRLLRFIDCSKKKTLRKEDELTRRSEINLNDWCMFDCESKGKVIGNILNFSYLNGTNKQKEYTLNKAPIEPPEGCRSLGLGVLAHWYIWDEFGQLEMLDTIQHKYVDISNYVHHVPTPSVTKTFKLMINVKNLKT